MKKGDEKGPKEECTVFNDESRAGMSFMCML